MENIQQFVTLIKQKGGVAKMNRFKIKIHLTNDLAPLSVSGDGGRDMSLLCESISFPNKTITSIDYSTYRNSIKIPTGFTNDDVTVVFHLTNDYYIKKIFDLWLNSIVDVDTYFAAYDTKFKTKVEIFQLDEKDREVYGVELRDAYPISMGAVELDNTATNATQKLTVDFTYNTWVPIDKSKLTAVDTYVGDVNFTPDSLPTEVNFDTVLS